MCENLSPDEGSRTKNCRLTFTLDISYYVVIVKCRCLFQRDLNRTKIQYTLAYFLIVCELRNSRNGKRNNKTWHNELNVKTWDCPLRSSVFSYHSYVIWKYNVQGLNPTRNANWTWMSNTIYVFCCFVVFSWKKN